MDEDLRTSLDSHTCEPFETKTCERMGVNRAKTDDSSS
jgi:hypothetical protein